MLAVSYEIQITSHSSSKNCTKYMYSKIHSFCIDSFWIDFSIYYDLKAETQ